MKKMHAQEVKRISLKMMLKKWNELEKWLAELR